MSHLTVVQLKKELKKKGCKVLSSMRKADLVALWEQHNGLSTQVVPKVSDEAKIFEMEKELFDKNELLKSLEVFGSFSDNSPNRPQLATDPFEEFFKSHPLFTPVKFSTHSARIVDSALFEKWAKRGIRLILVPIDSGIEDLSI